MPPCLAAFCRVQLLTLVHCPRRTSNAAIQKRIVAVTNGVDFLEGCGFEHATEGGEEVLLMDEPCSALDPIATARIEDLVRELKEKYTIVMVTHNMQQAA